MTKADADAVFQAGWTDEALFHAVAVCAYLNNVNRLLGGLGIVGTWEKIARDTRVIFWDGYDPPAG